MIKVNRDYLFVEIAMNKDFFGNLQSINAFIGHFYF